MEGSSKKAQRSQEKEFWRCRNCGKLVVESQTSEPCPECGSDEGYDHYAPKYIN